MAGLMLRDLVMRFGAVEAVRGVSIEVQSGEFFSILGPSGCGKTTLLRMIAGFEKPSSGTIVVNGKDITHVRAQDRGIGMVFQNYALFPHMTAFQNVAFGLQTRGMGASEIQERVERMMDAVGLGHRLHTPVPNLSGGEQQRVAVARALVVEPSVLLFDEPLSNLDAALRVQTRELIRTLQRATGITSVYVTHDQAEAMSLSDRMAVMNAGKVEQVGSPFDLYDAPASPFVGKFLGGGNLLDGTILENDLVFVAGSVRFAVPAEIARAHAGPIAVLLRPESIALCELREPDMATAVIEDREYLGHVTHFIVKIDDTRLKVASISSSLTQRLVVASRVGVRIDWASAVFFPRGGGAP